MFERMRRGMVVLSRDGIQVGRIVDVKEDGVVIEKGLLFHRDFLVPFSDIAQFRGEEVVLSRDNASLRGAHASPSEGGNAKGTVGVAGFSAPPAHGLGLQPTELTEARMEKSRMHDHAHGGPYDLDRDETMTPAAAVRPSTSGMPARAPFVPHEPSPRERRAAGPGWDPLSSDEEPVKDAPAPRDPDRDPPTRY
ncbi:PRC-barrel domain-containing protein [Stigmatella sp. ncwal1]|uniref:PRC-barrel domain-containing protein n=1 Tax=Stigmatella ashevillensis TaxID=2995309 RepID=A0ABT5DGW4_9BACT|nr:PRC-barrel domain-containing protein [Stigmatella ashevillena]MDC0712314.1 PRC-barrel domain-containing protein [Stigmatella ashevillena]